MMGWPILATGGGTQHNATPDIWTNNRVGAVEVGGGRQGGLGRARPQLTPGGGVELEERLRHRLPVVWGDVLAAGPACQRGCLGGMGAPPLLGGSAADSKVRTADHTPPERCETLTIEFINDPPPSLALFPKPVSHFLLENQTPPASKSNRP